MARADNSRKLHGGMDAILTQMYESGECSVGDIANKIRVTVQTVYPRMRRLGLPLLGKPGCKLRNYKSYGPRYNEFIFSKRQIALVARRNAEGWHDSKIAGALGMPAGPVRKLRIKIGLPAHTRKAIPIGIRFGNLVVLKVLSPKRKKGGDASNGLSSRSLCRCDCGGKRIAFNEDLRSGNTTTCGCRIDLRNPNSDWIRVFHQCAGGARSRGVKFILSVEQVKHICSLPCYYCGTRESNVAIPPKRSHRSRTSLRYNGIDQVVPCGGYHPGNVLPCCCFCNRAKSSLVLEEFVSWINRVFRRHLTIGSVKKARISLGKQLMLKGVLEFKARQV
jgi:hypothetical protein